jgi:endonuclease IV
LNTRNAARKRHLPLNRADMQYQALLQALIDFDAAGTIAIEAPEPFHVADCLTIQATYRQLRDEQFLLNNPYQGRIVTRSAHTKANR